MDLPDDFEEDEAIAELLNSTNRFIEITTENFGSENKFAKLVNNPMIKIRNRMRNSFNKFGCGDKPENRRSLQQTVDTCKNLIEVSQ